uniref:Uncharacterized protein n=1 Tax=viral metagenome TaxID=1070528 RepID=A0A6M3J4R8_9ZZZZ
MNVKEDEQTIRKDERKSSLWAAVRLLERKNIIVHDHPIYRGYCQGCLLQKDILALSEVDKGQASPGVKE